MKAQELKCDGVYIYSDGVIITHARYTEMYLDCYRFEPINKKGEVIGIAGYLTEKEVEKFIKPN